MQGAVLVNCNRCGDYLVDMVGTISLEQGGLANITTVDRAAISHQIKRGLGTPRVFDGRLPVVDRETIGVWNQRPPKLPMPSQQRRNLIRFVGDEERAHGGSVTLSNLQASGIMGTASNGATEALLVNMMHVGLVTCQLIHGTEEDEFKVIQLRLTIDGWDEWERTHAGQSRSRDGFIAMQFGDDRLDKIIADVVRGRVANALGVQIDRVDSPGKTKAGLIDNNMREAIEDAAFVLVELSHANLGAYWEAGLAEGLRKPVIYLCEQAVWDDPNKRPHFDVNHHVTIMWDEKHLDKFATDLVATIKNSLRHRYN